MICHSMAFVAQVLIYAECQYTYPQHSDILTGKAEAARTFTCEEFQRRPLSHVFDLGREPEYQVPVADYKNITSYVT